jgi:hypothetical protein
MSQNEHDMSRVHVRTCREPHDARRSLARAENPHGRRARAPRVADAMSVSRWIRHVVERGE